MKKLTLIAGPCAIEDDYTPYIIAEKITDLCNSLNIDYIFKGSYKKANRTKLDSFTGINKNEALEVLGGVKKTFNIQHQTNL